MKKSLETSFVIIVMLLTAIIFVIFPWHSQFIFSGSDMQFHLNRIEEIKHAVLNGTYPVISTNTFNGVGYAINTFYPSLTIYPFIWCFLLPIGKINSFYTFIFIVFLLTEGITYCFAQKYFHKRIISVLFTNLVVCSGYMTFVYWFCYDLGEMLAFMAITPFFFSLIKFSEREYSKLNWMVLAVSMSWIMLSHVLTAVLCVGVLIVFFLVFLIIKNTRREKIQLLKSAIKSGFLFMLLTAVVVFPMLQGLITNNIHKPHQYLVPYRISHFMVSSIDNLVMTSNNLPQNMINIGTVLFIALLFMLIHVQNIHGKIKAMVLISLSGILLASELFPWKLVVKFLPAVQTVQFTFRIFIFVILTITFSFCYYLIHESRTNSSLISVSIFIICINIIILCGSMVSFTTQGMQEESLNYTPSVRKQPKYADFKVDSAHYNNLFAYYGGVGNSDYFTSEAFDNSSKIISGNLNKEKFFNLKRQNSVPNQIKFSGQVKRDFNNVKIPVLYYNDINYRVLLNGKSVKFHRNHIGTISLNTIRHGYYTILIKAKPNKMFLYSGLLTALTILGVFAYLMGWLLNKVVQK